MTTTYFLFRSSFPAEFQILIQDLCRRGLLSCGFSLWASRAELPSVNKSIFGSLVTTRVSFVEADSCLEMVIIQSREMLRLGETEHSSSINQSLYNCVLVSQHSSRDWRSRSLFSWAIPHRPLCANLTVNHIKPEGAEAMQRLLGLSQSLEKIQIDHPHAWLWFGASEQFKPELSSLGGRQPCSDPIWQNQPAPFVYF